MVFQRGASTAEAAIRRGAPERITAEELFAGFRTGLHAGEVSHRIATSYRVRITGNRAELTFQQAGKR